MITLRDADARRRLLRSLARAEAEARALTQAIRAVVETDPALARRLTEKLDRVLLETLAIERALKGELEPYSILGLPVLDNFNRTESSLAGFWSRWQPATNTATMRADGANAVNNGDGNAASSYFWNNSAFGPDCGAFVKWNANSPSNEGVALGLALSSPGASGYSGYVLSAYINSDNAQTTFTLYRVDAGSLVPAGSGGQVFSISHAAGTEYGIARVANVFTFYRNGSPIGATVSESTYAGTGNIGMWGTLTASLNSGVLEDFGGGTIGGGIPPPSVGITMIYRGH